VKSNVWFKLGDAFLREYMGDDLALASMLGPVASVKDSTSDGHECIVEIRLERSVAVRVHDLEGIGIRNGQVVRGNAHKGAWDSC
jgi:hypothetical protein